MGKQIIFIDEAPMLMKTPCHCDVVEAIHNHQEEVKKRFWYPSGDKPKKCKKCLEKGE